MASSSKDINMPVVILLSVCSFILLAAGIELARGLYAMQKRHQLADPTRGTTTLTAASAAIVAAQEKNLHTDPKRVNATGEEIAFKPIEQAIQDEIASANPR